MPIYGNQVSHLGTYNSNAISAVAALATIDTLAAEDGAAFTRISDYGRDLIMGFNDIFHRYDLPLCAEGIGPVLSIFASTTPPKCYRDTLSHDVALLARVHRELLSEGIWIFGRGNLMIGTAHGPSELEETMEKVERVAMTLADRKNVV